MEALYTPVSYDLSILPTVLTRTVAMVAANPMVCQCTLGLEQVGIEPLVSLMSHGTNTQIWCLVG